MEAETNFRASPFQRPDSAETEFSSITASEGWRCLRFEFVADGRTPASSDLHAALFSSDGDGVRLLLAVNTAPAPVDVWVSLSDRPFESRFGAPAIIERDEDRVLMRIGGQSSAVYDLGQ